MNLKYDHRSIIYVVRACETSDDATDLIAVGGEHSVDILQISGTSYNKLASFHVGCAVTALAWSARTVSPSVSEHWILELTAAGANFGLHLLSKHFDSDETILDFGGGVHGHHGKINDMTFCGGSDQDSSRYVATVSDDRMLMVWDLYPNADDPSPDVDQSASPATPPQPTAYVIPFTHPLTSVTSHPSTSKELLVSDSRGSIFLTDWRSDPEISDQPSWRHHSLIELVEPRALSDAVSGLTVHWNASVGWRRDSVDIIGATYGSTFSIWDISRLHGGKPSVTGVSFPEGGHKFRWCPTYPDSFAIATHSSSKGVVIHIHDMRFIHSRPSIFNLAPKPHVIRDFDFLASRGIARIAAAVDRELVIFSIEPES